MKIGFVTDTNMLHKSENELQTKKEFLNGVEIFVDYIDSLSKAESENELIYFMPEIIIEELSAQKRAVLNRCYKSLIERYDSLSYCILGEKPIKNIDNFLEEEKQKYSDKYIILKLNYTIELLEELVRDSINKSAPFDKTIDGKKTDAGFKDALIWKSLLYSKEIDSCNVLYFFSSDKVFKDSEEELINSFKELHPNVDLKMVYIAPSSNHRQEALQKMISDNKLLETSVIKLYNTEMILNAIQGIKYDYSKEVYYNINDNKIVLDSISFNDFDKSDFTITDVNEIGENNFEVIVTFKTKKYLCLGVEENEIDVVGDIILTYSVIKNKITMENSKISNVKFYSNFLNNILSITLSNVMKTYQSRISEYMEELKKSLEPMKNINIPTISQPLSPIDTSYLYDNVIKNINSFNIQSTDENDNIDNND